MQSKPKISICIPQYGRSKYLIKVLESIKQQTYSNIEIVVSDDCSKDDTATVVPEYLVQSGMPHTFVRQEKNLGYDANLRAALGLGTGDYLLILGNDDALAYPEAIAEFAAATVLHQSPAVVLVNHRSYSSSEREAPLKRVQTTRLLPAGPTTALKVYRSFSFVGGIAYRRDAYHAHNTDAFDQSIFVQVYLASRIVAAGGTLLMLDLPLIAKDVVVNGKVANSHKDVLRSTRTPIRPHSAGLSSIAAVAYKAVMPYMPEKERRRVLLNLYRPLLQYTYPFWLYEHRRESFYRAAVSMSWGCYPSILLKEVGGDVRTTVRLLPYYLLSTAAGWLIPTAALGKLQKWGYARSKRL